MTLPREEAIEDDSVITFQQVTADNIQVKEEEQAAQPSLSELDDYEILSPDELRAAWESMTEESKDDPPPAICENCLGNCNMVNAEASEQCPYVTPPSLRRKRRRLTEEWTMPGAPRKKKSTLSKLIHEQDPVTQLAYLQLLRDERAFLDRKIYNYETEINYMGCRERRLQVVPLSDAEALAMLTVETLPANVAVQQSKKAEEFKEEKEEEEVS